MTDAPLPETRDFAGQPGPKAGILPPMHNEPLDKLSIRDLLVRCVIGVKPEERKKPQDILIDITLYADLRKACRSDSLRDSVDYSAVKRKVLQLAEKSRFRLIERLAGRIAEIGLQDRRVQRAQVRVRKPGALRFARCSEVEIVRTRPFVPKRRNGD